MKSFWNNYKSSIVLLGAILLGGIVGATMGEKAVVLKPIGELFLNLLFMTLVPLVFFSVTSAIANMGGGMQRLGKILKSIVIVFLGTALVAAVIGLVGVLLMNPTKGLDTSLFKDIISSANDSSATEKVGLLQQIVNTFTVNDFSLLLSRSNMLQLIVFSILFGIGTLMAAESGKSIAKFVQSGSAVMMKVINIIMMAAPIGLGCYMASFIGSFGTSIAVGYLKTFFVYLIIAILYYFIMYSVYAFIAGGKNGVRAFWKHVIPATVTAMGTCSSAACIPINIESTKKMGVPDDIAETTIPLGTSFHKDGSIIGSVFKIMFLVGLFGTSLATAGDIFGVLGVALLANLLITAVPIGGGTISEMLIITMLGYPVASLPILTIIATIIDMPATVLNVVGDDVSSMLVTRIVDGKKGFRDVL